MTTLYLCFANSDAGPLPTLRDEERDIKQALLKGAGAGLNAFSQLLFQQNLENL